MWCDFDCYWYEWGYSKAPIHALSGTCTDSCTQWHMHRFMHSVARCERPTAEDITRVQSQFIAAVQALYHTHKDAAGYGETALRIE